MEKVGRGYLIKIDRQYAEYEGLSRKSRVPEIKEYYLDKTRKYVKQSHWNSGSNISRNIMANNENKFEHQISTMNNYLRPIIRDYFLEPNAPSQWMKISPSRLSYIPLSEQEMAYLEECMERYNCTNESLKLMSQYHQGLISKEETKDKIFDLKEYNYGKIIRAFSNKFGFTPLNISYLEEVQHFE